MTTAGHFVPTAHASRLPQLQRPGLFETTMVPLTMFVLLYQLPEAWFRDEWSTDNGVPMTTAFTLALTGLGFLRIMGNIDLLIKLLRIDPALDLFLLVSTASIFWSANLSVTLRQVALLLGCFAWVGYLILRFELPQILKLLALASVPGSLICYFFIFALPQYGVAAGGQWQGVFSQKNALGFTAVVAVPLLVIVAGTDRPRRLFYYTFALLNMGLLVGSESKTMLLATVVPIALLSVFHGFRGRKTLRGAVILSLLGSTIFGILFVTANLAFIAGLLEKDVTLTGRTELWADLIPIALQRPVLGYGANAPFGGYFSPVHEVWIQNRWDPTHAHNAILQTWLELGVVGVVLFLSSFFRAIARAIEVVRRVPGRIGLWPLSFLTTTLMISISESGVMAAMPSYVLYVLCVWTVGLLCRRPITIDARQEGPDPALLEGTSELVQL